MPRTRAAVAGLHRQWGGRLVPAMTGWRRRLVVVGTQTPNRTACPVLMRNYALDLQERIAALGGDDQLSETLAFAQGRLLSIHPFADLNGRATRLFLRLLRPPPPCQRR